MATFVHIAMGTAISTCTHAPLPDAARADLRDAFERLEARFSLHRPETEGAAVARRELRLTDASRAFRSAYDEAIAWRLATGGAFTPHRPDGRIDLSGLVKALAIRDAGEALGRHGVHDWCINVGGDVLTHGVDADGASWMVGIVDPDDRTSLFTQFETRAGRRAVATSGVAERGGHVWRLGADATFRQVTVCAGDIVTADVLATAILAGGPTTLAQVQDSHDVDVLAAAPNGRFWVTDAFLAA